MASEETATPPWSWALLGVAVIAVSSAGIVLQEMREVPPLLRASWRMQGTSLVLLPGFIYQAKKHGMGGYTLRDAAIMAISGLFLAAHFGSWVWSLDHTSLVHSLLFVTAHPLVVVAIMPFFGSTVRRGHFTGAAIGFTGAAITLLDVGKGGNVSLIGDLAAFLGAITVVGYLMAGRHLRSEREMPIFVYAFPVTLLAGISLSLSSIALEGSSISSALPEASIIGWSDASWIAWVAYLSFGPGLCGHTGINTVLRWIPPIVVSITLLFEPVIGAIIGWMWTGDATIGAYTVIGGTLMIAGATLVTIEENAAE